MLKQRDKNQSLDRSEIHTVLSNDRRWRVLELLNNDDPQDLRSLANDIAAAESGESPAPRDVRQSVYVTLHQNHLPKLDSLDIVQYDDSSKMVELDDRANEIDGYLEVIEANQVSWREYHFSVAALGLVATVASSIGTPVLAALPPVIFATSALVVLLFSIGFQILRQGSPVLDRFIDN